MEFSTVAIYLKDLMATILTLVMMMSPTFGSAVTPYTAENPDELITSFAVVSDIHVETNNPAPYKTFKGILEGIKAGSDIDAVVYTGDNTMNGQVAENFFFYSAVKAAMPAKKNFVIAGNHDYGNGNGNYNNFRNNFIYFNNFYFGSGINKPYYYKVLNGCYMIVLSSEDITVNDYVLSDEQLTWLEGVLEKAEAENAPIFVFNHHPIDLLQGENPYALADLLSAYDNVLYFYGHTHNGLDADNFGVQSGVNTINVPRSTEMGDGIVVEVYEDEVLVKGRNFTGNEWIDGLRYTY